MSKHTESYDDRRPNNDGHCRASRLTLDPRTGVPALRAIRNALY